jgi:hypothetical protein
MTKSKKNNSSTAIGLVNGSMAVARQAAKVKNITRKRHFMQQASELVSSTQALSSTQSPYPVGSQFSSATLLFAASELTQNAKDWIQSHDKYRVSQIEVFVTLATRLKDGSPIANIPVEVYFYEDTDADPATQTSWLRTADRDNLGRVVLNALNPSMRLITFKPTLSFAAGAIDQNPSNVVPKKDTWLDALSLSQLYSGLRIFSCCAATDTVGETYGYSLAFSFRVTVEASQPI